MAPALSKSLKIAGWTLLVLGLAVATVFFWAYFGLAILLAIPIVGIVAVLRSLVRDLMGRRPEHTYVAGTAKMSHLPKKPAKIRHFADSFDDKDGGAT